MTDKTEKIHDCPICGTKCKAVGNTTLHYEPVGNEIDLTDRENLVEIIKWGRDSNASNEMIVTSILAAGFVQKDSEVYECANCGDVNLVKRGKK